MLCCTDESKTNKITILWEEFIMRLFYQLKVYDYDTKQEAEEHIKEMTADGWNVKK